MFKISSCHWRRQIFTYHEAIGWWHLPNIKARIPLGDTFHMVHTNALGMRADQDYPIKTPEGRKRIILLGDSYTAGDGVDDGNRFSNLMEKKYSQLDVMNFGLNGSGTDQQLLIFESIAKPFEADAYIFAILVENIARNKYTCFPSMSYWEQITYFRPKPYFTLVNDRLVLNNQPVPIEKRKKEDLADWKYQFPYISDYPKDEYAIYRNADSPHWHLMKRIIQRFLAQVNGKPVFIVPLPMYNHYLEQEPAVYMERFKELEEQSKKHYVIDVLPYFLKYPMKERQNFRFKNDPHYTTVAHKVVADALCEQIGEIHPEIFRPCKN